MGSTSEIFALYSNPGGTGVGWERGVSIEMLFPDGEDGFQVECGTRIQGGASRSPSKSPKHSWRLLFKGDYGPTKLRYQVLDDTPVDSFDQLILRAGYNNSWIHWDSGQRSRAQYIRDQWVRDTLRDMGQISSHGRFVHLYINGLYWGLYNLVERPNAAFAASYAGGDKEDYDALNSAVAKDGDTQAFSQMMRLAESGLASNTAYLELEEQYLDVTLDSKKSFTHKVEKGYTTFAYVFDGSGFFDSSKSEIIESQFLVVYEGGDEINITAGDEGVRFLLISGKPLNEPIAWRGPIVMNTDEELRTAFDEYQRGTFLKFEDE